ILSGLISPELSPSFLKLALQATWKTITYAVAGISLAVSLGFPLGVIASGVLLPGGQARWITTVGARLLLAVLRSAHELVWAWLFVAAIGLSPMAAVLALALPYAGILGRLYADFLNDVPEDPLRALYSSGASPAGVLAYGRIPMAVADMLSYTFYRFECGIRSAAILSFVGIQGIGYQIQLSLDELLYEQVWTLLFFLIGLIVVVDVWSSFVRRSLTR
ncbi:ABC transporter permease subunit, partial [Dehalococcoidia bacterium]|nr:ABC transporter permease subunit [Dehalococcoidia bacterium]